MSERDWSDLDDESAWRTSESAAAESEAEAANKADRTMSPSDRYEELARG